MENAFKLHQHWTKLYKDRVSIEIINSMVGDDEHWTYYLYLFERYIPTPLFESIWLKPKDTKFNFLSYDYYNAPLLNEIPMHGGITYYAKHGEGKHRSVKIGCDYAHIWDREHGPYSLQSVIYEAESSAEAAMNVLQMDGLPLQLNS